MDLSIKSFLCQTFLVMLDEYMLLLLLHLIMYLNGYLLARPTSGMSTSFLYLLNIYFGNITANGKKLYDSCV